jgi:hypothetical protein
MNFGSQIFNVVIKGVCNFHCRPLDIKSHRLCFIVEEASVTCENASVTDHGVQTRHSAPERERERNSPHVRAARSRNRACAEEKENLLNVAASSPTKALLT